MKVSLIFLCLVIAMTASVSECTSQSYCGRALVEILRIFCNSPDFEQYKPKNNDEIVMPEEVGDIAPLAEEHAQPNYQRLTGIVHECCMKPCTIAALLSYC